MLQRQAGRVAIVGRTDECKGQKIVKEGVVGARQMKGRVVGNMEEMC